MDLNNTTSQKIIIYQTDDGAVEIDVKMANDTVWLSLDLMAELFQRDKSTISRHIKKIFSEGELSPDSVVAKFATTAADGKLLREAMNFVKANTRKGWEKLPNGRKNKPEYAERAVLEALVNHFIHRDYTVMGGEVHLDIYDDRLAITSPGGMYNGQKVQDLPLDEISSERRNPILADVMAQLDYMEKQGSGLKRICNETKALDGYRNELKPLFKSTTSQFMTIIYSVEYDGKKGTNFLNATENVTENILDNKQQLSERQIRIIELLMATGEYNVTENVTENADTFATYFNVHIRTIKRDLAQLQELGYIRHVGPDKGGRWQVLKTINNKKN